MRARRTDAQHSFAAQVKDWDFHKIRRQRALRSRSPSAGLQFEIGPLIALWFAESYRFGSRPIEATTEVNWNRICAIIEAPSKLPGPRFPCGKASVARFRCCPPHQVNLTGTINIFDQARCLRLHREIPVAYASSAAIYGDCAIFPVSEKVSANPVSAYGADKLA